MFDSWLDIITKLAVGIIVLLTYLHFLGKLAPMAAMDQVSNIVLGGIMGGIIYNADIRIYEFLTVIVIWSSLMLLVKVIKQRSITAQNVIDGKPTLLVKDGVILTDNMASVHLNARDFMTLMHQSNIVDLDELDSVWYEQNGQVSIVKKGDAPRPVSLIEDGRIVDHSLERIGRDAEWVENELAKMGAKLEELFLAEWRPDGLTLYPYTKEKEQEKEQEKEV